ncbi:MAG: hypothetical protein ABFE08_08980 [Armatimonadia bacterium]
MSDSAHKPQEVWLEFIRRYRDDPVGFCQNILKVDPDKWQKRFLGAVAAGKRRITARSGHGVGKSTTVAWAAIWYITTRFPVKVVVTAPTSGQLFDALFAEIKRWMRILPPVLNDLFDIKAERIELKAAPTESFISARTSRAEQPEALQGVHAEYVMLVADEASGIPEAVFEAAAGSMSGHNAVTLLLGNPVRSTGFFYDTHHRLAADWERFHISCFDSPRVSADYIQDMKTRYGEESNAFRIRVLGEFPLADDDTVIPMELIESALHRDIVESPWAPEVWGLDVARFGSDSCSLAKRTGGTLHPIRSWRGLDLMQTAGFIKHEYDDAKKKPAEILVDVIGMGGGVVDRLKEQGLPVRGINVGESPSTGQKYANLRAELWFAMREWFDAKACRIPKDDILTAELAAVRYSFTSNGKIKAESKDQIKKRLRGSSPDRADSLALTFASTAASLAGSARPKNKPLKRNLKGIV